MKFLFVFLFLLSALFVPMEVVTAQAGGFVPCTGDINNSCSACHLVSMINTIIRWLLGIIFVIFTVLMTVAGFGLVTSGGNQSALDAAKSKFQNGLIGIIIVLAGFIIVDTLMRGIVGGGSTGAGLGEINGWGPWSSVECFTQEASQPYSREGAGAADPNQTVVAPPSSSVPSGSLTQSAAEARLAGNNITVVSSGSCTDRTQTNCTSLDGIRETTIDRVLELQQTVGVPLVITGGTEAGHSNRGTYTHANGYKVDIRPTPALNDYITSNFTQIGPTTYRDSRGNTYYRHPPDHWDITITN